jgi:phospholipid transport system transporter-binding protein
MGATVTTDNQGYFCIHGDLSFFNAPKVEGLGYTLIDKNNHQEVVFDLNDITSSDNTTLALLTAWTRYAKRKNKKLFFINCSQQLLDLAKVSGLEKLLPFKTK